MIKTRKPEAKPKLKEF